MVVQLCSILSHLSQLSLKPFVVVSREYIFSDEVKECYET